jgi:vacuolar-type H+-ATPase subunit F/Vma7
VEELLRRGYHVVFFTADLAPFLARLLARHSRRALPCLTELPLASGGAGAERMRSIVKRAVGADVLGTSGEEKE